MLIASDSVLPVRYGTAIGAGLLETTRSTSDPSGTGVPGCGSWLVTVVTAALELGDIVTVPSPRPAPVSCAAASVNSAPKTPGTSAGAAMVIVKLCELDCPSESVALTTA